MAITTSNSVKQLRERSANPAILSPKMIQLRSKSHSMLHQVDTYVSWINSQLEKRSYSRHVLNLSQDLRDGVVLLQLVEVISREKQNICNGSSLSDMRNNISNVLEFLSRNNVRIHHIMPKEIMEGNLKATMRLVLALAAHFKPDSFKYQTLQNTPERGTGTNLQRGTSLASLVTDAAASLAEASKNASNGGVSLHYKHRNQSRQISTPTKLQSSESSNASSRTSSYSAPSTKSNILRLGNCEIPDLPHSPGAARSQRNLSKTKERPENSSVLTRDENLHARRKLIAEQSECSDEITEREEVLQRHDCLLGDLGATKEVLAQLQNLLLNGCTPEEEYGMESPKDESYQEQLIMKNIILDHKNEECDDLRAQLNELKEINMTWSGEKTGLELRVSQQEQLILSLKSKLLHYEISKKNTSEQQLESLLHERDRELQLLHEELTKRDDIIHTQTAEIDTLSNDVVSKARIEANLHAKLEVSESMVSSLRLQVQELTERMHTSSLTERSFNKVGSNVGNITNKINEAKFQKDKQKISREHDNMKTTLNNIRRHFKNEDPVQHAFESMEHSMSSLIDTISMMESNVKSKDNRQLSAPKTCTVNVKSPASSDSGYDHNANFSFEGGEQVKIVYFLGKSITPVLKTSDIGLGFFTLRDFKQVVKRPGHYRYFFKSVDKDFGFVREELLFDDDIVPGSENKIVAWLEKSLGEDV